MITIKHTHEDGTLIYGTTKGDGVYDIVRKPENGGFRYFPSIHMIGIRGSRDQVADRWKIKAAEKALKAAGFEVTVEIDDTPRDRAQVLENKAERLEDRRAALALKASRHAGRAAAAHQRAEELSERFAGGQPILAGHHSERGARRDQKRIDSAMRTSIRENNIAQDAARRANAVGKNLAYSATPRVTARRIKTAEAELRKIQRSLDGYKREFKNHRGEVFYIEQHEPATGDYREMLLARKAQLENQLAYDRAQLAAAEQAGEYVTYGKHNVHVGDMVYAWGRRGPALKVNTVTVQVHFSDTWQPKVKFTDIGKVECQHGEDGPVTIAPTRPARKQPARPKVEVPAIDAEALAEQIKSAQIVVPRELESFTSPPAVVDRLMELADIQPGMTVLEPSAGTGNIALAAIERGALVDCVEINRDLANALVSRVPCVNCVLRRDFLELDRAEQDAYDRVVMNPPFSNGRDIAHVTHALRFLKPGGLLVAVMSAGVTFSQARAAVEFRALVEERKGRFEPLPDDAFAPSGTLVKTVIAVIPA